MHDIILDISNFFSIVITYAPMFLPAVLQTLELSVFAILLGTACGFIVVIMKMTKLKFMLVIANVYIAIIRGTPLLLQLFFIFYALPQLGCSLSPFISAIIGLALHNGAYISEIFRGAIESVEKGQNEAARALGMTKFQSFKTVIFPQAFKNSVPALGNQFILAIKDSSLASIITITEIITKAREFAAATYAVFPIYFDAGCYYMILTYTLARLLKLLEEHLRVNERRS